MNYKTRIKQLSDSDLLELIKSFYPNNHRDLVMLAYMKSQIEKRGLAV